MSVYIYFFVGLLVGIVVGVKLAPRFYETFDVIKKQQESKKKPIIPDRF